MKHLHVKKLFLSTDPLSIFLQLPKRGHRFLLDSAINSPKWGRFSYFGYEPLYVIRGKDNKIFFEDTSTGTEKEIRVVDTLEYLSTIIENARKIFKDSCFGLEMPPFKGGFVGYISYDFGLKLNNLKPKKTEKNSGSDYDFEFAYYDFVCAYDHFEKAYYLFAIGENGLEKAKDFLKIVKTGHSRNKFKAELSCYPKDFEISMDEADYVACVLEIKEKIRDGEVYVVNLANQFSFNLDEEPLKVYLRLRELNQTDYAAYLDFTHTQILCTSPELFLRVRGNQVLTKPIKGTRKRSASAFEDDRLKKELENDPKERAELAMIVDLERNDLSRVCRAGSVEVVSYPLVESYPQLHHLVGIVKGELKEGVSFSQLIKSTFPGGSITGAPKIAALKVIDEMENFKRKIYTGSAGFISIDGSMEFNIIIRTIVAGKNGWYLNAGSGITIDSNEEKEYEEVLLKAKALLKAAGLEV